MPFISLKDIATKKGQHANFMSICIIAVSTKILNFGTAFTDLIDLQILCIYRT